MKKIVIIASAIPAPETRPPTARGSDTKTEVARLREENKNLKTEISALRTENKELRAANEALNSWGGKLRESIEVLMRDREDLKRLRHELRDLINKYENR